MFLTLPFVYLPGNYQDRLPPSFGRFVLSVLGTGGVKSVALYYMDHLIAGTPQATLGKYAFSHLSRQFIGNSIHSIYRLALYILYKIEDHNPQGKPFALQVYAESLIDCIEWPIARLLFMRTTKELRAISLAEWSHAEVMRKIFLNWSVSLICQELALEIGNRLFARYSLPCIPSLRNNWFWASTLLPVIWTVFSYVIVKNRTVSFEYDSNLVQGVHFVESRTNLTSVLQSIQWNATLPQGCRLDWCQQGTEVKITHPGEHGQTELYGALSRHRRKFHIETISLSEDIGLNQSEKVKAVLKQKKELLQSHRNAQEEILRRKKELELLRNNNPRDNYPTHFDLLLEEGYVHLYDHLIQMRTLSNRHERESSIGQMSFSAMSHVILETRRAIIQKVNNSIPPDAAKILFLVGNTYSGKSTTLCFLRGDKMVSKRNQYESQSDEENLIGRPGEPSCTFLPNSAKAGDLIIIDFPGFEDTNGSLVSIGMQLALQALVEKYQPRILLLCSLASKDSNFGAASRLGRLLHRLLSNKARDAYLKEAKDKGEPIEQVSIPALTLIPGITHYLGSGRYQIIKTTGPEEQRKKRMEELSQSEKMLLEARYKLRADLKNLTLPEEKKNKECELKENENVLESVEAEKEELLLEIEEKEGCMANLKIDEKRLLAELQLGEQNLIRFDDLQSPGRLAACLQFLSRFFDDEAYCITAGKPWNFDEMQESLAKQFKEKLLAETEALESYCGDFNSFKTDVPKLGLFRTIFAGPNPEISELLGLSEIDLFIAENYENVAVTSYIKKLINHTVADINTDLIKKILKKMHAIVSMDKAQALQTEIERLQQLVMGLRGIPVSDKTTESWQKFRNTCQSRERVGEYQLPNWAIALLALPSGMPPAVHNLSQQVKAEIKKEAAEAYVDECCENLRRVYEALCMLKEIERVISRKDEVITGPRVPPWLCG